MDKARTIAQTDHRWSPRRNVELTASLYREDRTLGKFRLGNIGLEGLFVQYEGEELHQDDILQVEFPVPDGRRRRACRLAAVVRRVSGKGVALMFVGYDFAAFRFIQGLLYDTSRFDRDSGETVLGW